jgi:hypothetical protein
MKTLFPNPITHGCNANPCLNTNSKYWTWHWAVYKFHKECLPDEELLENKIK